VSALIRVWGTPKYQRQLETGNNYVKKSAWISICAELKSIHGIECTVDQIKNKIKKLRSDYEKSVTKRSGDEGGMPEFQFFEQFNEILGSRHSTHPPNLLDSMNDSSDVIEEQGDKNSNSLEDSNGNDDGRSNYDDCETGNGNVDDFDGSVNAVEDEGGPPPEKGSEKSSAVSSKSKSKKKGFSPSFNPYRKRGAKSRIDTDKLIEVSICSRHLFYLISYIPVFF
jgi:hypothetical protein